MYRREEWVESSCRVLLLVRVIAMDIIMACVVEMLYLRAAFLSCLADYGYVLVIGTCRGTSKLLD